MIWVGNSWPVKQQRPMAYLLIIDDHVEEMLRHDWIELLTAPWASNANFFS